MLDSYSRCAETAVCYHIWTQWCKNKHICLKCMPCFKPHFFISSSFFALKYLLSIGCKPSLIWMKFYGCSDLVWAFWIPSPFLLWGKINECRQELPTPCRDLRVHTSIICDVSIPAYLRAHTCMLIRDRPSRWSQWLYFWNIFLKAVGPNDI